MAAKKTGRKAGKKSGSVPAVVIFWLMFIIIITGIFLINRETIQKNFSILTQRLSGSPAQTEEGEEEKPEEEPPAVSIKEPGRSVPTPPPEPVVKPEEPPAPEPEPAQVQKPEATPEPEKPAPKPVETRERNLYFTQVDKDGQILRSRVSRKITVSDSPMQDALNSLLSGPTAEERGRGIISLIPDNTRILSILVRGSTAYISFSEDFQFNTYGVEGYAAQIRQIVWTATEFSNVKDVQILIEGRRVDYLGEGIWIGSPINRQSL